MILVDSNVAMCLVGAEHPNKGRAQAVLEAAVTRDERLVTDAEVLQEILHRYVAIGRRDAIHIAVMERHGIDGTMSFDAGFDRYPGLTRRS